MEYIRIVLSKNLLNLRKSRELTQSDIAKILDITAASYNRIENGVSWPDPVSLERLAVFYRVRSSSFFFDPETKHPMFLAKPPIDKKEIIKDLEILIDKIKNT